MGQVAIGLQEQKQNDARLDGKRIGFKGKNQKGEFVSSSPAKEMHLFRSRLTIGEPAQNTVCTQRDVDLLLQQLRSQQSLFDFCEFCQYANNEASPMSEKKVAPAPQFIVLAIASFYAGWSNYAAFGKPPCLLHQS